MSLNSSARRWVTALENDRHQQRDALGHPARVDAGAVHGRCRRSVHAASGWPTRRGRPEKNQLRGVITFLPDARRRATSPGIGEERRIDDAICVQRRPASSASVVAGDAQRLDAGDRPRHRGPSLSSLDTQHPTSSRSGWSDDPTAMAARPMPPVAHWITRDAHHRSQSGPASALPRDPELGIGPLASGHVWPGAGPLGPRPRRGTP